MTTVSGPARWLYACTALWSACLLFQVQPLLGKRLLPWFGGSPATWTTCLAFFQLALLLGYALADALIRRAPPRLLSLLSLLLPSVALLWLPLGPSQSARGLLPDAPVASILGLLGAHALVPFLALATTMPLVQRAYERAGARDGYRLYAFSNAGSLLGLVAYPLAVEPLLDLDAQQRLWSWGFGAHVALMVLVAAVSARGPVERAPEPVNADGARPAAALRLWIALACVPSALVAAVTEYITVDVAAVPFLWVVPLALYLGTYVASFAGFGGGRGTWLPALGPAVALLALGFWSQDTASLAFQLTGPLAVLLVIGMLLHGELARAQPAPALMSRFYLAIAAGGALGSVLVALVAPHVFDGVYELPLATAAAVVLAFAVAAPDRGSGRRSVHLRLGYLALGFMLSLAVATILVQTRDRSTQGRVIEQRRGFFGVLRVTDLPELRLLSHGRIRHGMQYLAHERRDQPTLYYGEQSGVGLALRNATRPSRRVAVVGLGAGTLAVYGRSGDHFRFYELSPEVVDVARRRFDFLRRSRAEISIAIGDARLSLSREPPSALDVLVLDAFASDSVPAHLLTLEAFALYLRHLRPDGVIAAHVSNRHLALERVVAGAARRHRLAMRLVDSPRDLERGLARARWAVLARRPSVLDPVVSADAAAAPWGAPVLWTDGFGNLLQVLR